MLTDVFIYGIFITTGVKAISESKPKNKEINVGVETVIEFDDKSITAGSLANEQSLVGRLRLVINKNGVLEEEEVFKSRSHGKTHSRTHRKSEKFTEFLRHVIEIITQYVDKDLDNFIKTFNHEFRRYTYRGCKFHELAKNAHLENAFSNLFEDLNNSSTKAIRHNTLKLMHKLKESKFDKREKKLVNLMNSLYTPKDTEEFKAFLNRIEDYKLKSRNMDLVKIMRHGVRQIIFNHYSKLNLKTRKTLIHTLKEYWNDKEYSKTTKIFKELKSIQRTLKTTEEPRTYRQMYVEKNLDLKYNPYAYDLFTTANMIKYYHSSNKESKQRGLRNNMKHKNKHKNYDHHEAITENIKTKGYPKTVNLFNFKALTKSHSLINEIINLTDKLIARREFEPKSKEKLPMIQVNEFSAHLEGLLDPTLKKIDKKEALSNRRRVFIDNSEEGIPIEHLKVEPVNYRRNNNNADNFKNKTKIELLENELKEIKMQMAHANNIINDLKREASENQKLFLKLRNIGNDSQNGTKSIEKYTKADDNNTNIHKIDDESIFLNINSSISNKEFRSDIKKDIETNKNEFDNVNTVQSNTTVQYNTILINDNKDGEEMNMYGKQSYEDGINYPMAHTKIDPKIMDEQLFTPIENESSSGEDTDIKPEKTPTTAKFASYEDYKEVIEAVAFNQNLTLTPANKYQFTTPRPYFTNTQRLNLNTGDINEESEGIVIDPVENFNRGVVEHFEKRQDVARSDLAAQKTQITRAGLVNTRAMGGNGLEGGNFQITSISARKGAAKNEWQNINALQLTTANLINVTEYVPRTVQEIERPVYNLTADLHYEFPEFQDILGKLVTTKLTLDLDKID